MSIDAAISSWVESASSLKIKKTEFIQSLWSNYGQCFRVWFESIATPLVVKAVIPPTAFQHTKGWNAPTSHVRKLCSFAVERFFYQHIQPEVTHQNCYIPRLYHSDVQQDSILLILEDLCHSGFSIKAAQLTPKTCLPVLKWLAFFHAKRMMKANDGLWPQGCYWHFDTRQEEFESMPEGKLKSLAGKIDQALKQCHFKTTLHGDAKLANFCFTPDKREVAAVDFQYCGSGPGVCDVAYFIGSALSQRDQVEYTQFCLDQYFTFLEQALLSTPYAGIYPQIEREWRYLYPIACADFHRFLAGWSPGHIKINDALLTYTAKAFTLLETTSMNTSQNRH